LERLVARGDRQLAESQSVYLLDASRWPDIDRGVGSSAGVWRGVSSGHVWCVHQQHVDHRRHKQRRCDRAQLHFAAERLGLKARENYEHPAATVILMAHRDLEALVLTRQELAFKRMVDDKWSELAYKGLVYEPLYAALNAFINTTQERVNGSVDLELYKGNVKVLGRSSPDALYSNDLVSFDSSAIDQCHAIGVSHYFGLQARLAHGLKKQKSSKK